MRSMPHTALHPSASRRSTERAGLRFFPYAFVSSRLSSSFIIINRAPNGDPEAGGDLGRSPRFAKFGSAAMLPREWWDCARSHDQVHAHGFRVQVNAQRLHVQSWV